MFGVYRSFISKGTQQISKISFMNFVFWQPILSIHQSAFLRNLAENNEVILIIERDYSIRFQEYGWPIPEIGKVHVLCAPSEEVIQNMQESQNNIHCFSGIDTCKLHYKAFKTAIKRKCRVGIMVEPFNYLGWKGKIRFLKYIFLKMKYNKRLSFILPTGIEGRWCFEKTGFSKKNIFDWGYFTERKKIAQKFSTNKIKILFVGSIDERKNIIHLVDEYKTIEDGYSELLIIGSGHLNDELIIKIRDNNNIHYLGVKNQDEVLQYIIDSDLLVLPSRWDGWGAVVNEALIQGTPVITSNHCGASALLDGEIRGEAFSIEKNNLKEILCKWISKGKTTPAKREVILNWANRNITGEVVAEYFLKIMDYIYVCNRTKPKPVAPWLIK